MKRLIAVPALMAAVVGLVGGGVAGADPTNAKTVQYPIELTCNGTTYTIAVNGNGDFTPGHDTNSTAMAIPLAFGPFTGTVTDPDGNVVDQFTDDSSQSKGQSAAHVPGAVACTFTFSEVSDGSDPEGPPAGYTFTGSGTATGVIRPGK